MYKFEVGKSYNAGACDLSSIIILKRTAKTCVVQNNEGITWRMFIKAAGDIEYMTDSSVPDKWKPSFTYYANDEVME